MGDLRFMERYAQDRRATPFTNQEYPMSDGNTAFQVGPADITKLIEFAQSMVDALSALKAAQDRVRDLEYDNANLSRRIAEEQDEHNKTTWDRDAIRDKLALLETQNRGTEEELTRTKEEVGLFKLKYEETESRASMWQQRYENELSAHASTRTERDDYGMKHLEVSEALAQANAKLQKFRELLGMDSGPVASAVVAEQPAPTPVADPIPEEVPATQHDRPWWQQG